LFHYDLLLYVNNATKIHVVRLNFNQPTMNTTAGTTKSRSTSPFGLFDDEVPCATGILFVIRRDHPRHDRPTMT